MDEVTLLSWDADPYAFVVLLNVCPILDRRISFPSLFVLCLFVCHTQGTPLDSETGWTGELWSNPYLLK